MALSAQDVHDKQFKLVRNSTGYDMDEVDAFLDEVEAEIARLSDELQAAREQIGAAGAVPEAEPASAAAARILEMAQRTADEYIADARSKADSMVSEAEKSARKSVKKLEAQRVDLEARVGALRTFETEIRSRLTGYFQSQLADLKALADDGER
ncbi:MAG: DivIVA domain-containing protein [Candidatus Nanopelagicales bacterium]|jgi:DivIVA domain-containing protein|nr:DivIVA domain-containing protein [Candidatus Nanopelagicales bacterium]